MICNLCDVEMPEGREDVICAGCREARITWNRAKRDAIKPNLHPTIFIFHPQAQVLRKAF